MPGWIDTWSFGPDGKNEGADATTQFAAYPGLGMGFSQTRFDTSGR